jgi:MFS family permease
MGLRRVLLFRFLLLYAALYASFGLSSPFLPVFLSTRDVGLEWLGFLLGGGTAVQLVSAPIAGRVVDVFGTFRLELAVCKFSRGGVAALFAGARVWDAGFGEPDPGCHAGTFSAAFGCSG